MRTRLAAARDSLVDAAAPTPGRERTPAAAVGRALAADATAAAPVPPHDAATTDGYAVRAAETFDAPPAVAVAAEQVCVGDPLPDGMDAVLPAGDAETSDRAVRARTAVPAGANVDPCGADLDAGDTVRPAGALVRPADLPAFRAAGVEYVTVHDAPRVAVLGDGGTADAVGAVLGGRGAAVERAAAAESADALREAAADHSLVVTVGWTGDTADTVDEQFAERLSLSPGAETAAGAVAGTPAVCLPEAPVAGVLVARVLVDPVLGVVAGGAPGRRSAPEATLAAKVASEPGIRTLVPVAVDGATVTPVRGGPTRPGVLARADGHVAVPESVEGWGAGERVPISPWERPKEPPGNGPT
jgi:molybdopterin molybdotransferase